MIYIILIIVIILLLIEKIMNININNNTNDYINNYEKKEYLLTQTELKFYKQLKKITDELNLTLFTQVSLYEIVKNKNYKDFNKIKSKSIDFVITEENCKIKLCIELDDKTHNNNKSRIERDNFINELFNSTNIKLIRIPVQNFYNIEELKEKIKQNI